MGGLPALSIQPIQQESLLSKLGKMQQLKGQQQNIQEGQLDIQAKQQEQKDQQTIMQVLGMHNGDLESALPELASKVTAKTFLGLQKAAVETKKSAAELDNKMLENHKLRSDAILGVTGEALKMAQQSPELYAQNWPAIAAKVSEIDPNIGKHVDLSKPVPPEMLQQYGLLFQTQSTALAQETAKRAAAEEQRKAAEAPVKLETDKAELQLKQQELSEGGKTDIDKYISNYFKEHNLPNTAANWAKAHKAYTDETKVQPRVLGYEALGNIRPVTAVDPNDPTAAVYMSAKQAIKSGAQSPQSIQYQTEKGVQKEFTTGTAAKNLTAFNTAIEHSKQLQAAADALTNGDVRGLNKIGNALGYQFGSDKMTNFNVIKSALSGEISKVFKGGQATDAEIKEVQGPFDAANSPAQLKGAIQNAIKLMNSKRDALKQQYESGKQGKPNFGGQPGKTNDPLGIR